MKTKFIIIGGLSLIGIGFGGYLIYNNFIKPKKGNEPDSSKDPNDISAEINSCAKNGVFPLKQQTGEFCEYENVKRFQAVLNEKSPLFLLQLKEDGKFGKNTLARLQRIFDVSEISKELYTREVDLLKVMPDYTELFMNYIDLKSPNF